MATRKRGKGARSGGAGRRAGVPKRLARRGRPSVATDTGQDKGPATRSAVQASGARQSPAAHQSGARQPPAAHQSAGARQSPAAQQSAGARQSPAAQQSAGARQPRATQQPPAARQPPATQQPSLARQPAVTRTRAAAAPAPARLRLPVTMRELRDAASREIAAQKARFQRERSNLERRLTEAAREIGQLRYHEVRAMQFERELRERNETIGRLQRELDELRQNVGGSRQDAEAQHVLSFGASVVRGLEKREQGGRV